MMNIFHNIPQAFQPLVISKLSRVSSSCIL
nr:MAG TPA: hypothetical protein [Caudoviricetes sp.]